MVEFRRRRWLPLVLLVLAGGCTPVASRTDAPSCDHLVAFANATPRAATHQVTLTTDWGGQFAEAGVIARKHCEHGGAAPGKALCAYLMENSSTEFAEHNVRRALQCLGAGSYAGPGGSHVQVERLDVRVSAYEAPGVEADVVLTVDFRPATDRAPPTLVISARRSGSE